MKIRRNSERGHADHGWLDTYQVFSFANYRDLDHMGFRRLRVINQDRIQPGTGFGKHHHRDMEIVSYVLQGALRHKDSMGNEHVIRPGEVQRLTAGTGVAHEEHNGADEVTEFLQMWVLPDEQGLAPSYDQQAVDVASSDGFVLVASPEGPVRLNADARMYAVKAPAGARLHHELQRHGWLHLARGTSELNGEHLEAGDGAALASERLEVRVVEPSEILLWDLP